MNLRRMFPLLLCLPLLLAGASAKKRGKSASRSDNPAMEQCTGVWEAKGDAMYRADTALGKLYEIPAMSPFRDFIGANPRLNQAGARTTRVRQTKPLFSSVRCLLVEKRRRDTRFVAIDFAYRLPPMEPPRRRLPGAFAVAFSDEQLENGLGSVRGTLSTLDGLWRLYGRRPEASDNALATTGRLKGCRYLPVWEPVRLRILFDQTAGVVTLWENGAVFQLTYPTTLLSRVESVAVTFELEKNQWSIPVELSPPTIRRFDDPALLERLPKIEFAPYPYEKYTARPGGRDAGRNPDTLYGAALARLTDPKLADPVEAVSLLKAAYRKGHLAAGYRLGLAYWRGLGVAPDAATAAKYLQEAAQSGCDDAAAAAVAMCLAGGVWPEWLTEAEQKTVRTFMAMPHKPYSHDNRVATAHFRSVTPPGEKFTDGFWRSEALTLQSDLFRRLSPGAPALARLFDLKSTVRGGIPEETAYLTAVAEGAAAGNAGLIRRAAEILLNHSMRAADPEKFRARARTLLRPLLAKRDPDAALLQLQIEARSGTLETRHFSAATDLALADRPLYHALKRAAASTAPEARALKHGDLPTAQEQAKDPGFRGLVRLARAHAGTAGAWIPGIPSEELDLAWAELETASRQGDAGARYLTGLRLLRRGGAGAAAGRARLEGLGHAYRAALVLAQSRLATGNTDRVQELLSDRRYDDDAAAWLLRARYFELRRETVKAVAAAREAGVRGMAAGFALAARLAADPDDWRKFLEAERETRRADRSDVYAPVVTVNQAWVNGDAP